MRFTTELLRAGKSATGIEIPDHVVDSFGAGKKPAVTVSINGFSYQSTVAVMGGKYMVGVSAERRAAAGIEGGDIITVDVELLTAPRQVVVPADFGAALDSVAGAREAFEKLAYSHRKEHVRAIEDAKKPETRAARIEKTAAKLAG